MPQSHVILLANFYGTYISKERFRAAVIINNAGIEQLAAQGVDKVKEIKRMCDRDDEIYVLIIAGLTDVLIKSVEDGKNKLEIATHSTQHTEERMMYSHKLLNNEGAKVIWAIMPPISLRMYHLLEGWNIHAIPGMSGGLEREQSTLNNQMINYRNACLKLNAKDAKRIVNGPFFTDLVTEYSANRSSMRLNTSYFESDGISPTSKLVSNWRNQVDKIFLSLDKKMRKSTSASTPLLPLAPPRGGNDSWDLPPPKTDRAVEDRNERGLKRSYSERGGQSSGGFSDIRSGRRVDHDHESREYRVDYSRSEKRDRDYSPQTRSPKIPSLVDRRMPSENSYSTNPASRLLGNVASSQPSADQMATAVQLLAATMQLSGGNAPNVQSVLSALMSQQDQQNGMDKKRQEEERALVMKKRFDEERRIMLEEAQKRELAKRIEETKIIEERRKEEERLRAAQRRREEERIREEERKRLQMRQREMEERRLRMEAERRMKAEADQRQREMIEEKRLREVQLAAKLAMEQQKIRDSQRNAMLQEQAQLALMAVTTNMRERVIPNSQRIVPSLMEMQATNPTGSALARINEKLKNDREKMKSERVNKTESRRTDTLIDKRAASDPAWNKPVVLFSFVNRNDERKPLRGVSGPTNKNKFPKALADYRSRGQMIYHQSGSPVPNMNFLRIQVKRPGELTSYEAKVAQYNNRLLEMQTECDSLMSEGRKEGYIVKCRPEPSKNPSKFEPSLKTGSSPKHGLDNSEPTTNNTSEKSKNTDRVATKGRRSEPYRKYETVDLPKLSGERARSRTPVEVRPRTRPSSVPPSSEAKPRWDQSDESDDELMWDDEPIVAKPTVDDETKSVKEETEVITDNDQAEPEQVDESENSAVVTNEAAEKKLDEEPLSTENIDSTRETSKINQDGDDFAAVDVVADEGDDVDSEQMFEHVDTNNDDFVTIDEAT